MNEILDGILSFVEGVPPVLRILITGIFVMLETSALIGLIVPGDTVVLVSSTGVTSAIQFLFTIVAVVAGALVGESIGFWLGRIFWPQIARQLVRSSNRGRQVGQS